MNTNDCRIYIVESNYLAAQYIRGLFNNGPTVTVKTIDTNSLSGERPIDANQCLLILDRSTIASALMSWGIKLKASFPNSNLIVISDREFGDRVHRMFQRWVMGIVEYHDLQQLAFVVMRAIKTLSAKEESICRASSEEDLKKLQNVQFSARQIEILELMCLRLSNKEIANLLNVQAGTVKFHVSNIFSKMGLRRRRDLFSQIEALVCAPRPTLTSSQPTESNVA
ncbi:MAG TPA: LuxR C-terminal-related transcriptional regulator [Candidatus Angelobacter sp.]|nr:LuxR C-terminal-related transcriptional regulator [Candidatus Angelobacter sp.]